MKKMINISNDLIKELRKRTNISIMKCKEVLIQTNGNIDLAIDNIRKFGLEITEKKSGRLTPSGLIITKVSPNKQYGIMIEINCETDFVAKENVFQEFANTIIITALNEKIDNLDKLNDKFRIQRANLISIVGENINICRFAILTGNFISCYTHLSKIGVLISVSDHVINTELIKYIGMHIIAKNPRFIHINDIPKDVIIHERQIQMNIAVHSGKSQNILDKIIEGRMNKFFNDIVLTRQNFILDINKTIGKLLDEHHLKIHNFIRFEIGEKNK